MSTTFRQILSFPASRAAVALALGVVAAMGGCGEEKTASSPPAAQKSAEVTSSPSRAFELKLCNSTASRVGVSIGYKDAADWTSEGWWNIASQTCETLLKTPVPSRYVYVHAVDYDRGGEWGGRNEMCTADKSFAIKGVQDCAKRGYKRTGFFEVDTGEAKEWTIRLTDPDAKTPPKEGAAAADDGQGQKEK